MEQSKDPIFSVLESYRQKVEAQMKASIDLLGAKTHLRDACEYALLNGGKRFRPILVFLIAEALEKRVDVTDAALAVEFLHTASLIADDLPCMDNDDERRNKPTVHKVFGEPVALLASYALIAAGYERLAKNVHKLKEIPALAAQADHVGVLALDNVTYNTGVQGATGGQFLDIFPPNVTLDTIKEVIHKKTVSLFEISFVVGWAYGGGDLKLLPTVKKAAGHFGMAFQIADDLDDMEQDVKNGRKINMALAMGKDSAKKLFEEEIEAFISSIKALKINAPTLLQIAELLKKMLKN